MQHLLTLISWSHVFFVLSLKHHTHLAGYIKQCCSLKIKWYPGIKVAWKKWWSHSSKNPSAAWFDAVSLWRKTVTRGPRRSHSDGFETTSTRKTMCHLKLWQNFIKCAPTVHLTKNFLWHMQFEIMVTHWNRLYCCTHIEYFIICALQIVPRIWLHVLPEAHTAWYFYINVYNCLMLCCESLPRLGACSDNNMAFLMHKRKFCNLKALSESNFLMAQKN